MKNKCIYYVKTENFVAFHDTNSDSLHIWSYWTTIAIVSKRGGGFGVLWNPDFYSATTTRHQAIAIAIVERYVNGKGAGMVENCRSLNSARRYYGSVLKRDWEAAFSRIGKCTNVAWTDKFHD